METIQDLEARYIVNTYNRKAEETPCLIRGEGARVWDDGEKQYLDFLGGLAVNALGHCHPAVVEAVNKQVSSLIHTSNLYYTAPQVHLAEALVESSVPGSKVFFANSGAEANEAAIKLARKYKPGRYKIITAENSFHGRTMATLTATGQPKYREAFKPLLDGFEYARFNDLDSFAALVDEQTAAIMIEPVQGEGGAYVPGDAFMKGLRELCDRESILLIFDEVQCGMGRTGKLWAFQNWPVKPDLFTAAKGLGGGLPIGAMVAAEAFSAVLQPGDHASTFGGNPVACSAALAVLGLAGDEYFLKEVQDKGRLLGNRFAMIASNYHSLVKESRGMGLIMALELNQAAAKEIQKKCTAEGLLVNAIGENVIRVLPPLTISGAELEEGLNILEGVLQGFN